VKAVRLVAVLGLSPLLCRRISTSSHATMGVFTEAQPNNPHIESGYTILLHITLEVTNRFHFSEKCALRPPNNIPNQIFKSREAVMKMKHNLNSPH